MEPGIADGDGLIGMRTRRARAGEVRVFRHPYRPDSWLVKRVHEVRDDDTMWVLSDNADATRADSRTFGSLPVTGSYRVILRIPARLLGVRGSG